MLNIQLLLYCDGVAIDTSQAIDVIYAAGNTGLMSNTVYKINTNGGGAGSISIQGGNNSHQIMYCSPTQIIRVADQGSSSYRYNIDTNVSLSMGNVTNWGYNGGAYNPVDKIAWISNYGPGDMRKFTANF